VRGQRHGREQRGVRSVAVDAGASRIHSLDEGACGSESKEKREKGKKGMRKGLRSDRSAQLEGSL